MLLYMTLSANSLNDVESISKDRTKTVHTKNQGLQGAVNWGEDFLPHNGAPCTILGHFPTIRTITLVASILPEQAEQFARN